VLARLSAFASLLLLAAPVGGVELVLDPDAHRISAGRYLALLEDPARELGIEEVSSSPLGPRFEPAAGDVPNLGLTRSAWWARLRVTNPTATPLDRLLVVEWPLTDVLTLYTGRPGGGFDALEAGADRPFRERAIDYRNPALPIRLAPGETRDLWLRFHGDDALVLPLVVTTAEGLTRTRVAEGLRFGAYFTFLLVFAALNLAFFLSTRDRSYLHLVILILAVGLWQLAIEGLAFQWLWPESPRWAGVSGGVSGGLATAGFAVFVRSFLLTPRHAPTADRVLVGVVVLVPVLCGLAFVDLYWVNRIALPLGAVLFATALVAAVQAFRRGFAPGRDFLLVYSFALLCLLVYGADATFGIVQSGLVQTYGLQVAFLGSAVLFTTATARRVALFQREALRASRLRMDKEEADRASREKSRFLASASHDLRQPLHSLGLFAETLALKLRNPEERELLERIQMSHRAMEQMFDGVLDISKLDAGLLQAEVRDFALAEIFDTLRSEMEPQAAARGLRLRVVPTSLALRSDPLLLLRILRNLVTNALRYTDRGGVVVGARRVGRDAVRIEVHDSGRGITEEQQSRVFEEYTRLEAPGRPVTEGLGLGLAIVDRLARLLGHEVGLRSAPGRGSVFHVTVPRGSAPVAVPVEPRLPADTLAGRVVLVVDDDPEVLRAMRELLSRWGVSALGARSAAEAGSVAEDLDLDMIVSDLDLGGGTTGFDAIAAIRAAAGCDAPALLVSGDTSAESMASAQRAGLLLLHKPVAPARLRAALTGLIQRASRPDRPVTGA
jgi:signal transduction histidine kinase/CheY-like chemotaxis protein